MRDDMSANPGPAGYSLRFDEALVVAAIVHRAHVRKGTTVPYIAHPVHVTAILARHGYGERVQLAGLLHDVLEDVVPEDAVMRDALRETFPAQLGDLAEEAGPVREQLRSFIGVRFGEEVLRLVECVTEAKKDAEGHAIPWAERKRQRAAVLRDPERSPREAVALKTADSLHNAQSIVNDLRAQGLRTMKRFNATPEETFRHYGTVLSIARERLGTADPLARELALAIGDLGRALDQGFTSGHQHIRQAMRELGQEGGEGTLGAEGRDGG